MDRPLEKYPSVYNFILTEETAFKTATVPLANNWNWNMRQHIERSFLLKNSQFYKGDNQQDTIDRPFNNIILPIANVNYRTEGFDVKDIEAYVEDSDYYHLSLLARKYHERWARQNKIDTFIDEIVTSYFDYGLVLVKNVNDKRPEVVDLRSLAFCDQADILSGPICIKHQYSVNELLEMQGKWDSNAIQAAVQASKFVRTDNSDQDTRSPGKYIEVYELHGSFPTSWLNEDTEDTGEYSPQLHIITYYKSSTSSDKLGLTLFKGKETKSVFKALKRDEIFGRACGRGGIEELFHAQIWTNSSMIHLQGMLESTSKVILKTTDKKLKNQRLGAMKNGQVLELQDGGDISQVNLQPINKAYFDQAANKWEQIARGIGSASDPQLGLNPTSGTPLGTTQIVTEQGQGIHDYRRGQVAVFVGEIYDDWVTKYLQNDLNQGDKWLDELSMDELKDVAENFATNLSNERLKQAFLNGHFPPPEAPGLLKQVIKTEFMKGGKKRFLEVAKGEFTKIPLKVQFNIAGKQKDIAGMVQKLNAIFRTLFANPQVLQAPGMGELFNEIIESSGLSPIDFDAFTEPPEVPATPAGQPSPAGGIPSPMMGLQEQLLMKKLG